MNFKLRILGQKNISLNLCKGEDPYKMFLIACDIERDYLPLLNGKKLKLHTFGLSSKYNMTTGLYLKRNITTNWTPKRGFMDTKKKI